VKTAAARPCVVAANGQVALGQVSYAILRDLKGTNQT
jgi:hypothetical protein